MKTHYCKIAALPLLVVALTVIFSCKKNAPEEEPTLSVTNSSAALVFSADGKTMTADGSTVSPVFTVTTNQPSWDAQSNQTWLKLTKEDRQFILTADANTGFSDVPAATVTVTAGTAPSVVLYVTQETPSPEESEYAAQSKVLGHGYDVTGLYAASTEIKSPVLDFTRLVRAGMLKKDGNLSKAEFYTNAGYTVTEYTNSLAVRAGVSAQAGIEGVCAFGSELSTQFSAVNYKSDRYSFATSTSRITKDAWFIENRTEPTSLRQYVSATFLNDLDTKTAADIIAKYGTHVMLGGIWGAKLDHYFCARKKIEAYSKNVGAEFAAKASMTAGIITGDVEFSAGVQTNFASYYEEKEMISTTIAHGGRVEFAESVHSNGVYKDWIESIEGNEVWTDYYPDSLIPIYEFIIDEAKRSEIQQAYNEYLAGKKIIVGTSRIQTNTHYGFTLVGADILNGDGEIDSKDGKDTKWQVDITLSKVGTQIRANFVYLVTEGGTGSNLSKFRMDKNVDIPIGKNDFIIDDNPAEWHSGEQTYAFKFPESDDSDVRGWIEVSWIPNSYGGSNECPFLRYYNWWIKLDDRGGSDNEKVGIKGWLDIHYSYLGDE